MYIHPIAETDNIKDLQHGWNYTLSELIGNYKKIAIKKSMEKVLNPLN